MIVLTLKYTQREVNGKVDLIDLHHLSVGFGDDSIMYVVRLGYKNLQLAHCIDGG